jgi:hypothetical protein
MPVKRYKDMSGCIRQWKLKCSEKPYYWHVYLWDGMDAFLANTAGIDIKDGHSAKAAHCPCPTLLDPETGQLVPDPKLGELHFMKGKWDLEIVAHELLHAMFHRARTLCSGLGEIAGNNMSKEELLCYEFGGWVDALYRKLWDIDPNPKWVKS